MRKLFICILIAFATQNLQAKNLSSILKFSKTDTATYPVSNFLAISWQCYLDQPINIILNDLNQHFPNYILSKIYPGHRFFAKSVHVYYGDDIVIVLSVRRFKFMNPSPRLDWDINLFCKESAAAISVWQNNNCLYKSEEE
ncbi:MAG: hypothetical protein QM737_18475 [Ferruginibacter sp.]